MPSSKIKWTNEAVKRFAGSGDPIERIQQKSREVVYDALQSGWSGPPFNPIELAEILGLKVKPNGAIRDAMVEFSGGSPTIYFNPSQPRSRLRFSIAHEIAHTFFPEDQSKTRYRDASQYAGDDWQLETLCNLAAAELVLPAASWEHSYEFPEISELVEQSVEFDVSVEALVIRRVKAFNAEIAMFCASPDSPMDPGSGYRYDYSVSSPTALELKLRGKRVKFINTKVAPKAIGHSSSAEVAFEGGEVREVELVGVPGLPGQILPRIIGVVRQANSSEKRATRKTVQLGDILYHSIEKSRVICFLLNNASKRWGGGIAKKLAENYPDVSQGYSDWISEIPFDNRLGEVFLRQVEDGPVLAGLIGQHGFGRSTTPRIRYKALAQCLEKVGEFAQNKSLSVHLPKIGTGAAKGDWDTIEEIIDNSLVKRGLKVVIYTQPPKRKQLSLL